jgi:hypothetical protein
LLGKQAELAVTSEHRRLAGLQVNVARAKLHGTAEYRVEVHGGQIGS